MYRLIDQATTSQFNQLSERTIAPQKKEVQSRNIQSAILSLFPTYNSTQSMPSKLGFHISISGYSIHLLITLLFVFSLPQTWARSVVTSKCYFFGPGTTINGADYRRDYGLSRKECAEQCKFDVSCLAFEWLDDRCTLKSKSLNGTITAKADAYFGLCVDFEDSDRDRFYEHELGGAIVNTKENIDHDSCSTFCSYEEDAIIYSWRTNDEKSSESLGNCSCITVLHSVKLSFGSTAGFLI